MERSKWARPFEKIKVTNFKDPSKSIEIKAAIDTGVARSVLPMNLIQKFGSNPRSPETRMVEIFMATSPNSGHMAALCPNLVYPQLYEMADS